MRRSFLSVLGALTLAACGQGNPLTLNPGGWQLQESRDQLTGVVAQTASRIVPIEHGTAELTAVCRGMQLVAPFHSSQGGSDAASFGSAEMNEMTQTIQTLAVMERASPADAVEFRLTFAGAAEHESFVIAGLPPSAGEGHPVPLRASRRDGETGLVVGLVSHLNAVSVLIASSELVGANAPAAFRIEVPLLLDQANGSPPLAQNIVVDLSPQDSSLRQLVEACNRTAAARPTGDSSAGITEGAEMAPAPATTDAAYTTVEIDDETRERITANMLELLAEGSRNFPSMRQLGGDEVVALLPGADHRVSLSLSGNTNYVVLGVCDGDCTDVDVEVIDGQSGGVMASDTAPGDFPVVRFTPSRDGQVIVRTILQSCSVAPCFVGARVLSE